MALGAGGQYAMRLPVHSGRDAFPRPASHGNGMEIFRSYAETRLAKLNGIPDHIFRRHLKESGSPFSKRDQNL